MTRTEYDELRERLRGPYQEAAARFRAAPTPQGWARVTELFEVYEQEQSRLFERYCRESGPRAVSDRGDAA